MSRLPHAGYPSHSYLFLVYLDRAALASPSRKSPGLGVGEEGQGRIWGGEVGPGLQGSGEVEGPTRFANSFNSCSRRRGHQLTAQRQRLRS